MDEFRTAVRTTLKIKASSEKIDELFQSFDEDSDGVLTIKTEVRPAIRNIHLFCKSERARESRAQAEVDECDKQMAALSECAQAAKRWETASAQCHAIESSRTLEIRLGEWVKRKLADDDEKMSTEWDIAVHWGATGDGMVKKEEFLRSITEKKADNGFEELSIGDLRDMLSNIFDSMAVRHENAKRTRLATTPPPPSLIEAYLVALSYPAMATLLYPHAEIQVVRPQENGVDMTEKEMRMDLRLAIRQMVDAVDKYNAEVEKLAANESKLMNKARALQITYAERAARFDKQLEWQAAESKEKIQKGGWQAAKEKLASGARG